MVLREEMRTIGTLRSPFSWVLLGVLLLLALSGSSYVLFFPGHRSSKALMEPPPRSCQFFEGPPSCYIMTSLSICLILFPQPDDVLRSEPPHLHRHLGKTMKPMGCWRKQRTCCIRATSHSGCFTLLLTARKWEAFLHSFQSWALLITTDHGRELIPGRRVLMRFWMSLRIAAMHSKVHKFGMSRAERQRVVSEIEQALNLEGMAPERAHVVLAGDFNMSLQPPAQCVPDGEFRPNFRCHEWRAGRDAIWQGFFFKMVEVEQPDLARYCLADGSSITVDRILVSLAGRGLIQLGSLALAIANDLVEVVHHKDLADHTLVSVDLEGTPRTPPKDRPIPKELFATSYFQDCVNAYLTTVSLDELSPPFEMKEQSSLGIPCFITPRRADWPVYTCNGGPDPGAPGPWP